MDNKSENKQTAALSLTDPVCPEPCPHCGEAAEYHRWDTAEWVSCTGCDAGTPQFFTHGRRCDGQTQRKQYDGRPSVTLWNARHTKKLNECGDPAKGNL